MYVSSECHLNNAPGMYLALQANVRAVLCLLLSYKLQKRKKKSKEKLQLSESKLVKLSAFCSFSAKYLIQVNYGIL